MRYNFELNVLTQEFLLYGSARTESQMRARYRQMGQLLTDYPAGTEQTGALVSAIQQSHQELQLFYDVLLGSKATVHDQLAGALLVKAQEIRSKARRLADLAHAEVLQLQRHADMLVVAAVIALAVITTMLLALMARQVNRSIGLLKAGMSRVEGGDLESQIRVERTDELGLLAQDFNRMNERLRDTYTSIERLTAEVA
ncbi:HAMP domain-containing protein, partial [Roseateles sp. GG27B]